MEVLSSHITIGKYTFDFVNDVAIDSSWKDLTNTATITLPSKLKFDKGDLRESLKKGDAVSIQIGYNNKFNEVFTGVVARVKPTIPVVIECEDMMWHLKQIEVNKVVTNTTLKDFLIGILPQYKIDCFDIKLPRFVASKISVAKLLDSLKTDMGLYSFIRNGVLVVGKQYDPEIAKRHNVILNYNVANDQLEYSLKDDIKISVTAISNLESGQKIEYVIGAEGGDTRTLNFFNLQLVELKELATKEYDRLVYDGFKGSITIFGEPFVAMGDIIHLTDTEDTDKAGSYWVDAVQYSFGLGGYRQTINLGPRNF